VSCSFMAKARFDDGEWRGFTGGAPRNHGRYRREDLSRRGPARLSAWDEGAAPRLAYQRDQRTAFLWAQGFIPRLWTYPGREVPKGLLIDVCRGRAEMRTVLRDVLALTKLNYNACTYGDGFLAIGGDPECHDEAMLADVHAVDQQADHVEPLERGGLPRCQLRRRLRDEPATHRALARAPASHRRRHRLEAAGIPAGGDAHQHLVDDAPIEGSTSAMARNVGQGTSSTLARTRGRRTRTLRPPRTTSLLTVPPPEAWRLAT
jgi:hypothetical protein